jgi:DnaJ like chaperone protein
MLGVPRLPNLNARLRDVDGFDPFAVLGVAPGAQREKIKEAYFALAKAYHPDRYAMAELPSEVIEYLFAMARRINAAHAALNVEQKKKAMREAPVFVSAGR